MRYFKQPCGCQFPIDEEWLQKRGKPLEWYLEKNFIPPVELDIRNVPKNCPAVWDMLSKGLTKGVFQLESALGRQWTKRLKPTCIEHLCALGSLLRPGCISGDTSIAYNFRSHRKDTKLKLIKMKDLYTKFHQMKNDVKYRKNIVSCDESNNEFFLNKIEDVIYSGEKEVYSILIKNSHKLDSSGFYDLECTNDHKLLTKHRGWVELKDLEINELIAVRNDMTVKSFNEDRLKNRKNHFHGNCFYNYEYRCIFCDWHEGSLDVNHLEHNREQNNHPSNLCYLCPNHHRVFSEGKISKEKCLEFRKKFELNNTNDVQWAYFKGKVSKGIKDTYDITVSGPNHNFIAGNVIVHNCLRAIDKQHGCSLTELYCRRKNGEAEVEYLHKCLESVLGATYGILTYQEQAMQLTQVIAGFNLQEADMLRKAIGKKLPEEMAKVEKMFYEGAAKCNVMSEEQYREVFGWIKESQRYSFNKSHSLSYGVNGYWSAYCKAHMPPQFFTSYLRHAKEKAEPLLEIRELVNEARLMDIEVLTPDLRSMKKHFFMQEDEIVRFGLADVKGIGEAQVEKLKQAVLTAEETYGKKVSELKWFEFLVLVSPNISSTVAERLIEVGALSYMDETNVKK